MGPLCSRMRPHTQIKIAGPGRAIICSRLHYKTMGKGIRISLVELQAGITISLRMLMIAQLLDPAGWNMAIVEIRTVPISVGLQAAIQ